MLVTGMMFPVQFLPRWLQFISAIHPQRYLLDLARKSLSLGTPLNELWPDIYRLLLTGTAMLVMGIIVFRWGFDRARREGTIGHQ
jgi:ABC-2 type transport system permease protein